MSTRRVCLLLGVSLCAIGAGLSGCGGGGSPLQLTLREQGKTAKLTAPTSATGGLTTVSLKNEGKMPHAAQLVLIKGNHTVQDALKVIGSESNKSPAWLRAEGGVGSVPPGQTGTATVVLPPGKYGIADLGGPGSMGPPASAQVQVQGGKAGSLPSTNETIVAAAMGPDRYGWKISGPLKTGMNRLTFKSEGMDTLHFIGAFRVTGNPSKAQIIKGLKSNGKPPPFVDQMSFVNTAVLESGKSEVAELPIMKPGKYVIFCPLTDRDGGREHFEEGMLTMVDVK